MGMTLDDLYYLMQHPIDSAVGTAGEFMEGLPNARKKYKKEAVAVPVPVPVPERPAIAFPTSTLPVGSSPDDLYSFNQARGNRVRSLMK